MCSQLCEITLCLAILACVSLPALGATPTAGEFAQCKSWVKQNLAPADSSKTTPAFSFVYDGKSSSDLLPTWKLKESTEKIDKNRTRRTQVYTDSKTGLQVRMVVVSYSDYPTVEWTVYLKNTGSAATPIIENIQALDGLFAGKVGAECVLHHATGSPCRADDYQPLDTPMPAGSTKVITTAGGRPTNSDLSYFNIEWPFDAAQGESQGVIMAIGWPGQWAAKFNRDSADGMRMVAGQELTHMKLLPGEEIRTPLIVLQFWAGDRVGSQNVWRRWMVAHNMPHPGGKPMAAEVGGCHGNMVPTAKEEIDEINAYLKDGFKLDHWIIDAGWYPSNGQWWNTGTWEPDKNRFPKGLREVADRLHQENIDFIVWFEPERCVADSWIAKNHPEWVLGGSGGGLVNLGNPGAWKWVVETVDGILVSQGIDHYRSDYNIDPLGYWRGNDTEDRQGITENLYVQGHLAFWDELLHRHPNMFIDTCASGGRRNDIETLRRSVPILRSDYPLGDFTTGTSHGQQAQTYGISYWIPYEGTGAPTINAYAVRSSYCPISRYGYDALSPERKKDVYAQALGESNKIKPYWLEDYYPLTPYSLEKNTWIAWQFDAPSQKGGFVQAFRRDDNGEASMTFKLRGLDAKSDYLVTNLDDNKTQTIAGRALLEQGLQVNISIKPGSALFVYKKAK